MNEVELLEARIEEIFLAHAKKYLGQGHPLTVSQQIEIVRETRETIDAIRQMGTVSQSAWDSYLRRHGTPVQQAA